ncbi:hypothetical protein [Jiulongibacter sediminis]|uniref:hypothetical protein n=1 Tax=Jiulongibacter sediminis TaxID=1605367 RepID=UPI0012FD67DC|nr:hypothetical protein [Jiulongibacter sediminis]
MLIFLTTLFLLGLKGKKVAGVEGDMGTESNEEKIFVLRKKLFFNKLKKFIRK